MYDPLQERKAMLAALLLASRMKYPSLFLESMQALIRMHTKLSRS